MKISPTRIPLLLGLCGGLTLAAGCSAKASVDASSEYPQTGSPSGTDTRVSAVNQDTYRMDEGDVVAPDYMYDYAFDRDDDGSHAKPRELTTVPAYVPRVLPITTIPFVIHEDLFARCRDNDAEFYFDFDSAKPAGDIEADVERIVDCLQDPRMVMQKIEIVGHADQRGTTTYNAELGLDRAHNVADALKAEGLSSERVNVRSMGEARADDPQHWDDRRVIIRLE